MCVKSDEYEVCFRLEYSPKENDISRFRLEVHYVLYSRAECQEPGAD